MGKEKKGRSEPKGNPKKGLEMKPALHAHHWSVCLGDGDPAWSQHPRYLVMPSTNITQQTNCPGSHRYCSGRQLAAKGATNSSPVTKLSAG